MQTEVCNFGKKRLCHGCFPANFAKFLRTPFLRRSLLYETNITYFSNTGLIFTLEGFTVLKNIEVKENEFREPWILINTFRTAFLQIILKWLLLGLYISWKRSKVVARSSYQQVLKELEYPEAVAQRCFV